MTAEGAEGGPRASEDEDRARRHAVVIGGGLAGLLAAHVLTAHADKVTLVERDRFPEGPDNRSGIPQDKHTHVMLEGGQGALEKLLPGIVGELLDEGSPRVAMPTDVLQWQVGHWYRRTRPTTHVLTGSRPLTDWVVRRRVLGPGSRIETVEGAEVTGLLGDATRVRGVRLRERGLPAAATAGTTLEADIVVDASGRSSRAPSWLAALGAEPPHEEVLETGLAYATRFYRTPAGLTDPGFRGVYIIPNPDQRYGGILMPLDGDRWSVILSGLRGNEPPTDDEGFLDFASKLPHPVLHDWLLKAEPLTPIHGFRKTGNVRRRYDGPGRRPAGFLATGEALCAFNPVYGQGMSVAALCAVALRDALTDPRRTPTTGRVQRALLDAARQAWDISSGADKNVPGATGNIPRGRPVDRPGDWYLARVQRRATGDPVVGEAFRRVLSLTAPVTSLFAPPVAKAVLFGPDPQSPVEPQLVAEG
ncbi:NAD(P)/FAD-dependent oxidoreductase [Streptomyces luteoverticillatus]|uniref:NAD(P)/FAD-dependent oxidoreductase n=1 Tax=Streptomyces luteoverticillatus TaxID=66425 RepID=UPI001F0BEA0E|nr:FAD-dependent oxidoreductase [Streptomyces luteoverticillatus]